MDVGKNIASALITGLFLGMIFHGFRYVSGKIEHKKKQWQFNRMSPDEQARTLEEEARLETLQNLVKEEREKNARAELERMRR